MSLVCITLTSHACFIYWIFFKNRSCPSCVSSSIVGDVGFYEKVMSVVRCKQVTGYGMYQTTIDASDDDDDDKADESNSDSDVIMFDFDGPYKGSYLANYLDATGQTGFSNLASAQEYCWKTGGGGVTQEGTLFTVREKAYLGHSYTGEISWINNDAPETAHKRATKASRTASKRTSRTISTTSVSASSAASATSANASSILAASAPPISTSAASSTSTTASSTSAPPASAPTLMSSSGFPRGLVNSHRSQLPHPY